MKYIRDWNLSVVWAFNGALVAFAVQTVTQLVVGYISDKTVTSFGRRKPFVVVGQVIRLVSVMLLATPPSTDSGFVIGWFTVFLSFYYFGDAIFDGPYDVWMVESSADDKDYTKVYSIANPIGGVLGGISGVVLLTMSPLISALGSLVGGCEYGVLYFAATKSINKMYFACRRDYVCTGYLYTQYCVPICPESPQNHTFSQIMLSNS